MDRETDEWGLLLPLHLFAPGHGPLIEDRRNTSEGCASLLLQVINLQGQTLDTHTCYRPGLGSWAARVGASTSQGQEAFQALFPKEFLGGKTSEREEEEPMYP